MNNTVIKVHWDEEIQTQEQVDAYYADVSIRWRYLNCFFNKNTHEHTFNFYIDTFFNNKIAEAQYTS